MLLINTDINGNIPKYKYHKKSSIKWGIFLWFFKGEKMDKTAFDFKRIAQGYKSRPFLHKQVIEKFQSDITSKRFTYGLDVGCGAGLSTKALKLICKHVIGADISSEMINIAREVCEDSNEYHFMVSKAEEIPAMKEKIDIITVAGAIQWIDRQDFLHNINNIISDDGYVLIYDFSISDMMRNNDLYNKWWHNIYLKEFPKPYRNEYVWTSKDVKKFDFTMLKQIELELEYEFDLETFVQFMMIQSNVNAKIDGEGRDIEEVHKWFEDTLTPIFTNIVEKLVFKGYSWYMQKNPYSIL